MSELNPTWPLLVAEPKLIDRQVSMVTENAKEAAPATVARGPGGDIPTTTECESFTAHKQRKISWIQ